MARITEKCMKSVYHSLNLLRTFFTEISGIGYPCIQLPEGLLIQINPEISTQVTTISLMSKRTPFYEIHRQLGARLIDFGGYEMPVQYESIRKEHEAVRNSVGLFDVSHMGEFFVTGPEALGLVQYVTVNNASVLQPGDIQYSAMCYEDGGIVDDLLVYRLEEDNGYMLVVNASNRSKDLEWIRRNSHFETEVADRSDQISLLAVQGPGAVATLQKLTDLDLGTIERYTFKMGNMAGHKETMFSATGYTGEEGFEIYFECRKDEAGAVWNAVMEAGGEYGIVPCGLGARDTLRLEMGYALYGNDITADTNPLEARLGWLTKFDKGDFVGRKALLTAREKGIERKLVGFRVEDKRAIPRPGYRILGDSGEPVGKVTSGSQSITLGRGIGMGYVSGDRSAEGTKIFIEIRNKRAEAKVVSLPFVKKG